MLKNTSPGRKRSLSIIQFCASSNLLFSYEQLIGPQTLSRNELSLSLNPIGQHCLGGLGYSSRPVKRLSSSHVSTFSILGPVNHPRIASRVSTVC